MLPTGCRPAPTPTARGGAHTTHPSTYTHTGRFHAPPLFQAPGRWRACPCGRAPVLSLWALARARVCPRRPWRGLGARAGSGSGSGLLSPRPARRVAPLPARSRRSGPARAPAPARSSVLRRPLTFTELRTLREDRPLTLSLRPRASSSYLQSRWDRGAAAALPRRSLPARPCHDKGPSSLGTCTALCAPHCPAFAHTPGSLLGGRSFGHLGPGPGIRVPGRALRARCATPPEGRDVADSKGHTELRCSGQCPSWGRTGPSVRVVGMGRRRPGSPAQVGGQGSGAPRGHLPPGCRDQAWPWTGLFPRVCISERWGCGGQELGGGARRLPAGWEGGGGAMHLRPAFPGWRGVWSGEAAAVTWRPHRLSVLGGGAPRFQGRGAV